MRSLHVRDELQLTRECERCHQQMQAGELHHGRKRTISLSSKVGIDRKSTRNNKKRNAKRWVDVRYVVGEKLDLFYDWRIENFLL